MDNKIDLLEIQEPKNHAPFFELLEKSQETVHYTSYKGDEEGYKNDGILKKLQTYMKASDEDGYNELVQKFPQRMFRRTKGEVYEMIDEGKKLDVQIALQVKEHSLTWYFWKKDAMDQYPQEFRDILYQSAAEAHRQVENGCDLYYRGSNSVHVKVMHHVESESGHNHNHYRLKNNQPYTPEDFNQHMDALKKTQAFDQFFNGEQEITNLKEKFKSFYEDWHTKEKGLSKREEYMSEPSQQLNEGDVIELMLFGHQQEPCRINPSELKVDYDAAREKIENALTEGGCNEQKLKDELIKIKEQYDNLLKYREKGGSRGLFSEIASTRQTYKSELEPIAYVGGQDSSFGAPPEIPEWAKKLTELVNEGKKAMIETRAKPEVIGKSQKLEFVNKFEKEIPEHVRKANIQKTTKFRTELKNESEEDVKIEQKNTNGY